MSEDPAFLAVGDDDKLKGITKLDLAKYLANPQLSNSYSYTANNPLKFVDKEGEFLDTVIDAGFVVYDVFKLGKAIVNGGDVKGEATSLGLDIGSAFIPGVVGLGTISREARAVGNIGLEINKIESSEKVVSNIAKAYQRPTNATTRAQREFVQGKSCVTCGQSASKMVADHKDPLVKEYYRTGSIDVNKMRDVKSIQPQCSTCSNKQGGQLSNFSKQVKKALGL